MEIRALNFSVDGCSRVQAPLIRALGIFLIFPHITPPQGKMKIQAFGHSLHHHLTIAFPLYYFLERLMRRVYVLSLSMMTVKA